VHRFEGELWRYTGEAAWYFVTLPGEVADDIAARTEGTRRGFGSVRVEVTVGASTWRTSVFPDKASGSFLLPVKRQVRDREQIDDGDVLDVRLEVVLADPIR
jgi:hypothetical protein